MLSGRGPILTCRFDDLEEVAEQRNPSMRIKTTNTIFYCRKWEETVRFYRDHLDLTINFSTDWFVEFRLSPSSRLSIADERRAFIKSCHGKGITLSLEVDNIDNAWEYAEKTGLRPTTIKKHPWGARLFYLFDPEERRIEIWQSIHQG